jgi:poly-gamma-glutamate synthesis protein (capsule biosynthesis protein)
MKNKEFWDGAGKIVAIMALVIAMISLTMTISSRMLEKNVQHEAQPSGSSQEQTDVINILAAGMAEDTGTIKTDTAFSGISSMVSNYDLAAWSQKSLIGTEAPTSFADAVQGLGFNMAGLANAGALAQGPDGITTAMDYWQSSQIQYAGTNTSTDEQNQIRTVTKNNITAVFLSFTDQLDGTLPDSEKYLVNVYDDTRSPEIVAKADEAADVVIVDMYWSGQDGQQPTERQKQIARALADAGASIIIGNAPDAIQPVAWIDDTLIFYSMGNLITDRTEDSARLGLVGAVTVTKTVQGNKQKIELFNPRVDLCASVKSGDSYAVKMFDAVTADDLKDRDTLYSSYSAVLLSMDDSIRIGGME